MRDNGSSAQEHGPGLATRAGVSPAYIDKLRELGILPPDDEGVAPPGDVRRVRIVQGLERSGLALPMIGQAIRQGDLTLDFVDQPSYDRFAADVDVTFREISERHSIPLDLVRLIREAMGFPAPEPDDRLRETEMDVVPLLAILVENGVSQASIERTLRVAGDGLRRLAETEAAWWRSEILGPLFRSGVPMSEIGERTADFATEVSPITDRALTAIYHGQQGHAWMSNIFEGFEALLERIGLHERMVRPPAICFFDVTGYSRLTEERGDAEAAELAGRVARVVQRTSADHAGKPIKWLGDGVMLHFPNAGSAVLASLDMIEAVAREGLPTGHVGIHAGPVLFQEGDYFGRTVNGAARISDHATKGQVLVSQAVVDAADLTEVGFTSIGAVELKGLLEPMVLYKVSRSTG